MSETLNQPIVFRKKCDYFRTKLKYILKQALFIRSVTTQGEKYYFDLSKVKECLLEAQNSLSDHRITISKAKERIKDVTYSKTSLFIFTKIKHRQMHQNPLIINDYK